MQQRFWLLIAVFMISFTSYAQNLYQAEVIKLSDADSLWIRINGVKMKLNVAGIDAPEEYKSRKMRMDSKRCHISRKYIRKMGRASTGYAKSILKKGDIVKVKIYKKEGNEIYGLLFLPDGSSYSNIMVKQGYACVSNGIEEKRLSKLKKLLLEAKKKKMGLWKDYYKVMECLCKTR